MKRNKLLKSITVFLTAIVIISSLLMSNLTVMAENDDANKAYDVTFNGPELNRIFKTLAFDYYNVKEASVVANDIITVYAPAVSEEQPVIEEQQEEVAEQPVTPEPTNNTEQEQIQQEIVAPVQEEIPAPVAEQPAVVELPPVQEEKVVPVQPEIISEVTENTEPVQPVQTAQPAVTEIPQPAEQAVIPETPQPAEQTAVPETPQTEQTEPAQTVIPEVTESEPVQESEEVKEEAPKTFPEGPAQDVEDTYIQSVIWSDYAPADYHKTAEVSFNGKLKAWFSDETGTGAIYLYNSDAENTDIEWNENISMAFKNMKALSDVSGLNHIKSTYVTNMDEVFMSTNVMLMPHWYYDFYNLTDPCPEPVAETVTDENTEISEQDIIAEDAETNDIENGEAEIKNTEEPAEKPAEEPVDEEAEKQDAINARMELVAEKEPESTEFNASETVDGVTVTVTADEGIFPEGCTLSVTRVEDSLVETADSLVEGARTEETNVAVAYTFDIKVFDADGQEVQPADESCVRVSFTTAEVNNPNLETQIYHIPDNATEAEALNVILTDSETVSAETTGFSIYRVEFTYGNARYIMAGGETAEVNDIIGAVGLTGNLENAYSDSAYLNVYNDYGVWKVTSYGAFDTEEYMSVTLDGVDYDIRVTDAQGTAYAILQDDGTMVFCRSNETHTSNSTGTVEDIAGNTYTGTIYAGFENNQYTSGNTPWKARLNDILHVVTVEGQTITPRNLRYWFQNCSNLQSVELTNFDGSSSPSCISMFQNCASLTDVNLTGLNLSSTTSFMSMFRGCSSLTDIDLTGISGTSGVTTVFAMFQDCSQLASADISTLDFTSVQNAENLFSGCSALADIDLSAFNAATGLTNTASMFLNCSGLTSLDVSSLHTENVTNMRSMFAGCSGLESLDISSISTAAATRMDSMFARCSKMSSITLGPAFSFKGNGITTTSYMGLLPTPPLGSIYSGKWVIDTFDMEAKTPESLRDEYTPATMSGTWIWEVKYNVSLDAQGGFGGTLSVTVSQGAPMPEATMPTRHGYVFDGYYTETEGNGIKYYNADGSSAAPWASLDVNKLYANWTKALFNLTLDNADATENGTETVYAYNGRGFFSDSTCRSAIEKIKLPKRNYTVTYNGNGGTAEREFDVAEYGFGGYALNDTQYIDETGAIIANADDIHEDMTLNVSWTPTGVLLPGAERTGYELLGWYTDAEEGEFVGNKNDELGPSENGEIFAHWKAKTYTVTLNPFPGDGGDETVTATYDADMPEAEMPTRTGYTFKGYFTEEEGKGTQYYNEDGTSAKAWDVDDEITLYASWEANKYDITLDRQGATSGDEQITVTYDAEMPEAVMPEKENHLFRGYFTEENGEGEQFYDKDGKGVKTWDKTDVDTLYANWLALRTITVENTVSGTMGNKQREFDFKITFENSDVDLTEPHMTFKKSDGNEGELTLDENGSFNFQLSHGETIEFHNVPDGTEYSVEESGYEYYTVTSTNEAGTVENDITVSFENNHNVAIPTDLDAGIFTIGVTMAVAMAVIGAFLIVLVKRRRHQ